MSPDFSTSSSRTRYRELVAGARAHGRCDDKAAGTLLSAVDGAMKDQDKPTKTPSRPSVLVEVARFARETPA
jgi:hypothetical protein